MATYIARLSLRLLNILVVKFKKKIEEKKKNGREGKEIRKSGREENKRGREGRTMMNQQICKQRFTNVI